MTAQSLASDGTPIDWCQRCSCAVVHEPIVCEDCRVQLALNDEDDPKPQPPGPEFRSLLATLNESLTHVSIRSDSLEKINRVRAAILAARDALEAK